MVLKKPHATSTANTLSQAVLLNDFNSWKQVRYCWLSHDPFPLQITKGPEPVAGADDRRPHEGLRDQETVGRHLY